MVMSRANITPVVTVDEQQGLVALARSAGATGKSWHDWVMSDEIQDVIAAMPSFTGSEQDAIEKAFEEGRRERSAARGRIVWTTAPKDYDGADATELEIVGDYFGKPLRKIAIDPEGYQWQTGRYASGIYGVWDKDPVAEDRRVHEEHAKFNAERAAVEAKHAAGREWLHTATAEELADEDLCWEHGATHKDTREERSRRHAATEEEGRTAEWARVAALIPEGSTLIDDGAYIPSPMVGLRPIHRPSAIHYDVRIVHGWPDTAERAQVHEATGKSASKPFGTAAHVADMLSKGQLRVAKEGEAPPRAVAERIGYERWKDIRRVEVQGKIVWVGRATFGSEDLVLDENGRLVRTKKIADAAQALADAANQEAWSAKARGHAWAPAGPRSRARKRPQKRAHALRSKYGRSGGWFGEGGRHAIAARKGWATLKGYR